MHIYQGSRTDSVLWLLPCILAFLAVTHSSMTSDHLLQLQEDVTIYSERV